ncbi:MAG TPA: nucleotidyltransferase [Thermotoga sp.]|nr:MAG: nucleotidyltransferase [Thermotogota bacterium]RKX52015.1 MAG: nucleotidyltransferase [Thermotoga sp.]HDG61415.1 nucleotidyltransferase [Thermotoga sp.]
MRVLGIVVEYNPFHNGHLFHLQKAKELIKPDYTIAVMSGNFCQRGEPAIIDKFSRAEIALKMGVDVVFELPTVYAIQDAGGFARGAIGVLDGTGVVTDIVFGSESNDIEFLKKIAEILHEQPDLYNQFLHEELKKGYSFPNARKYALMRYVEELKIMDPEKVRLIERSNDILGLEYVRAILDLGSSITPHTIKRVGADYKEEEFKGRLSSATSIRKLIRERKMDLVRESVPEESFEVIRRELEEGRGPIFLEDMEKLLLGIMRLKDRDDFSKLYGFSEGLDERFYRFSRISSSIGEFMEKVKSKRFTFTRIRRLMLYVLFEMRKDFVERSNEKGPQYLRILGFTESGRNLLSKMKKASKLPIVSTVSLYRKVLEKALKDEERNMDVDPELFEEQLLLDIKATNVHSLFFKSDREKKGERDFRIQPIFLSLDT